MGLIESPLVLTEIISSSEYKVENETSIGFSFLLVYIFSSLTLPLINFSSYYNMS